jgi:hypothetical protein
MMDENGKMLFEEWGSMGIVMSMGDDANGFFL